MNGIDSQLREAAFPGEGREQATFQALFEEAPVAYHELDEQGIVRRVNQAHCDLLGYSPAEMIGRPIWVFAEKGDEDRSRLAIARKLAGKEALTPCRRNYVSRRQRLITVEVHSRLIVNEDGQITGLHTALLDVTEQVGAETATREAQKWLTTTLDALTEGVVAVDPLGTIRFINRAAEELTGWPAAEAPGRDVAEVLPLRDTCVGDVPAAVGEIVSRSFSRSQKATATLSRRSGAALQVSLNVAPIMFEDKKVAGIVFVFRAAPAVV